MFRKTLAITGVIIGVIIVYFVAMPVPVDPKSWDAPPNPGYTHEFAVNNRLKGLERIPMGDAYGPEDIAEDHQGNVYAATQNGTIVRLAPEASQTEEWINTGGRPLGMEFNSKGDLIVADAYKGILSISPEKEITILTTEADGKPIYFPDDLDVARDGKVYFSDASSKFTAKAFNNTYVPSLLDLLEHGKYGRLLMYDPETKSTSVLLEGISFANGVAVSHDQNFVLVSETGEYRVIRYWLNGPKKGQHEQFGPYFPGFPDNISAGLDGRYWVALFSPRIKILDETSDKPFLRKMLQRLPEVFRPNAKDYGHIIALDENGAVVEDLQDPDTTYPTNTNVTETKRYLYIGSLFTKVLGRLDKSKIGL